MNKIGKKLYCLDFKYRTPEGFYENDTAIVRADNLTVAMARLEYFIDRFAYGEYRGRKFLYIFRITGEQEAAFPFEIGKNDILKTIHNGRLN